MEVKKGVMRFAQDNTKAFVQFNSPFNSPFNSHVNSHFNSIITIFQFSIPYINISTIIQMSIK